jgi:hypothetical protein
MLTNCTDCIFSAKFRHHSSDVGCANNPAYWEMWNRLRTMESKALAFLPVDICGHFTLDKSCSTEGHNSELIHSSCEQMASHQAIPSEIQQVIREVINWQDPTHYGIQMVEVESSNIAAIGYDEHRQVLQVEFGGGSLYRYQGVSEELYLSFFHAPSKGRFFHQEIRDAGFLYERLN